MVLQLALARNLDFIACQDLDNSKRQVCVTALSPNPWVHTEPLGGWERFSLRKLVVRVLSNHNESTEHTANC